MGRVEVCEPRDFIGLIYVESKSDFSKKKYITPTYFFHFEPLEIIGECHVFAFMTSITKNINGMKAQYPWSSDHSCS